MRLLAGLATLAMLAAAALAGEALWRVLNTPPPDTTARTITIEAALEGTPEPQPPQPPRRWEPLFGEVFIPEPQPPAPPEPPAPEPEPEPPLPPLPPLDTLGYELNGVVRSEAGVWAMVSHPTGQRVLRVGDVLEDVGKIARITEEGLWVDRGRDSPDLLEFAR